MGKNRPGSVSRQRASFRQSTLLEKASAVSATSVPLGYGDPGDVPVWADIRNGFYREARKSWNRFLFLETAGSSCPLSDDLVLKVVLITTHVPKKWKTESMASAPTVIAHRGAREAARENTLPAFRLAREFGAEWVELDARRTADGVVVVHHDAQLADGRVLAELTVDELPEFIPSLAEALEECHGMGVNIEIKNLPSDPDYDADHLVSEAVAGVVQAYLGPERTIVSSFNIDTLDRLHAVDPAIPLAYLFAIGDPAMAIARACAHEMTAIHPYDPLVTASLVERAQDEGLAVNVWTVNDPERMKVLAGFGVDGICTDVPDVARDVLDTLQT
ncbi:MAG: glycerophosphodiester phosphodiesterase [Actinobacteria bacterium]|nr:glycerophosphodiester phosphodiesterase [Actinomycetota bacterium]